MYIDAHQHFWQYDPQRDGWIDDSMKAIRRDFMPSDLKPVLREHGIQGCIAVQASQSEDETRFLLECAREHAFIKGVTGWVDLLSDKAGERLEHFSENVFFRGVRHIVQAEPDGFMSRPDFRRGITALKDFGLTYDILVHAHQLPEAIALVRQFPAQPFVLDHIAKPAVSKGVDRIWAGHIRELAQCGNVYCKVSGMVTETEGYCWEQGDFEPFLEAVTEAFGTDRIMFGSDWPVCLVAARYGEVVRLVRNFYSEDELPGIMGQNAVKFYGISGI
ncbi:amidohydrolase [Sinomicrobium soli]|nr:amidohydrolase [Sinomicrobium sp. N-1-3-6]